MTTHQLTSGTLTLFLLASCGGGESPTTSAATGDGAKCMNARACVSTVAGSGAVGFNDGAAQDASFWLPHAVAIDRSGGIHVADYARHADRTIGVDGNVTSSGAAGIEFPYPANVAVDAQGTRYVADTDFDRILMTTAAGVTTTLAGTGRRGRADGDGRSAEFSLPTGLVLDREGNLVVADMGNRRIRKITLRHG